MNQQTKTKKTFFVGLSRKHTTRTRRQTFNKMAMHRTAQSQRGVTSFSTSSKFR